MKRIANAISITVLALAAACSGGGTKAPVEPGPGGDDDDTAEAPLPDVAFEELSHDQQKRYMKEVVLPQMKELFVAFDAETYKDMDCATCHGDGAKTGEFEMPNEQLPVLPATEEGWAELAADPAHGPMLEFMGTKVKPTMAKLLRETEFNPETGTGDFGCHGCHTMEAGAE